MKLTDKAIRGAKPAEKPYKLFDGYGLYLEISPKGAKYWRMLLLVNGKQKRLSFGAYPEISLAEAREKRDEARKAKRSGKELSGKRAGRPVNSFEAIALEWHEKRKAEWTDDHAGAIMRRLEMYLFPKLGNIDISQIEAPELLEAVRKIEKSGALDTAGRVLNYAGRIFRYAIATGRARRDPSGDLRGALESKKEKHFNRLTESELPDFLRKLYAAKETSAVLALKLTILTMTRTGETRFMQMAEVNLEKKEWRIPAERMKMNRPHIVPLSKQAIGIMERLMDDGLCFRQMFKEEVISENAMLAVLKTLGYKGKTTVHGFRATASTILNEHGFMADVIERQLAHVEGNKVRAAYNHAQYLPQRRLMMQWWADYLDAVRLKTKHPPMP